MKAKITARLVYVNETTNLEYGDTVTVKFLTPLMATVACPEKTDKLISMDRSSIEIENGVTIGNWIEGGRDTSASEEGWRH